MARLLVACAYVANAAADGGNWTRSFVSAHACGGDCEAAFRGASSRTRSGLAALGLRTRDALLALLLSWRDGLLLAIRRWRNGLLDAMERRREGLLLAVRRRRDGLVLGAQRRRKAFVAAYHQFWLRDRVVSHILRESRDGQWYRVLQVRRKATKKQLKEAYRRLAKRCHPDKTRDDRATMAFDALRDAFDLLQDQRLREEHDRKLEREDREREQKRRRQRAAIVRAAVGALRRLGRTVVGAIVKFF